MPPKITSKNLQYNTTLPPFLARLRGEATSSEFDGGPDPILAARRRPTKNRSGSAGAEDAPTVVDEHGNTIQDVTVGLDGTVKATTTSTLLAGTQENDGEGSKEEDQQKQGATAIATATIGAAGAKKRKAAKVVGADADEEEGQSKEAVSGPNTSNSKDEDKGEPKTKPKKKAKKIKLSFGDDEG